MQQKSVKKAEKTEIAARGLPEILAVAERMEATLARCAVVLERLVGAK